MMYYPKDIDPGILIWMPTLLSIDIKANFIVYDAVVIIYDIIIMILKLLPTLWLDDCCPTWSSFAWYGRYYIRWCHVNNTVMCQGRAILKVIFHVFECWSHSKTQAFVTTQPADVLAPDGARTSAGTVMTTISHMIISNWFYWFYWSGDIIPISQ